MPERIEPGPDEVRFNSSEGERPAEEFTDEQIIAESEKQESVFDQERVELDRRAQTVEGAPTPSSMAGM